MEWISQRNGGNKTSVLKAMLIATGPQNALRLFAQMALKNYLSSLTPGLPLRERSGKTVFGTSRGVWVGSILQIYMQPGFDAMGRRIPVCIIDTGCKEWKSKELSYSLTVCISLVYLPMPMINNPDEVDS